MNIHLMLSVLILLCLQLAQLFLGLVLKHGILTARQLCCDVAELISLFFQYSIFKVVGKQILGVHDSVCNRTFGFQSLIGGHVKTILNAKAYNPYGDTHFFVHIALTQEPTHSLPVVHRTVRRINVHQRVKTLLYVHAYTKTLCCAEYHADFSGIDLCKDFLFGLVGHAVTHDYNLLGRHTLRNQFGTDVIE